MKVIYKYNLNLHEFTIDLPINAQILTVQTQYNEPQLWALIDPEAAVISRKFLCLGTGTKTERLNCDHKYIGTFQLYGGDIVIHLFELL